MENQPAIADAQEQQLRNEMLFTLSNRDTGTVATIVTANEKQQRELRFFLQEHLKEYTFYNLDLTTPNYTSLSQALLELLPEPIRETTKTKWLINITGLQNTLHKTKTGEFEYAIIPQLNFERELLFKQPQILILWINKSFYTALRKQAPDLMHWLSKRFVFDADTLSPENAEEAFAKGPLKIKGKTTARTDRITELEALYEKLCTDHADKERLIKDKINILVLLGKEYREAFDFEHSEEALKKALSLIKRLNAKENGEIDFELANTYLKFNKFNKALEFYKQSLQIDKDIKNENYLGRSYHQIGMVHAKQRNWQQALENYQQAIESNTINRNEFALGNTYHQIGMAYEKQRNWQQALKNYEQAIEWFTKTGNEFVLGSTYHQIGIVYAKQSNWQQALENYQQAIEWNTKMGNEFVLGSTYHQIGTVYAEQRNWQQALENYQQALEWDTKTGNEFVLGSTYHQIGKVYEEQSDFEKSRKYFLLAKANREKYNLPFLESTKASLKRIEEKLNEIV